MKTIHQCWTESIETSVTLHENANRENRTEGGKRVWKGDGFSGGTFSLYRDLHRWGHDTKHNG